MKKAAALLLLAFLPPLAAHASDVADPPAFAVGSSTAAPEGVLGQTQELVLRALSFIGVRYKWGGNSPDTGFDCSGLIRYVYQQVTGLALPGNAREISEVGIKVERSELRPGDLVFFNTLRRPFSHVGIYLGEARFVHAPSRGGRVEIVDMSERYWQQRFNGARRLAT